MVVSRPYKGLSHMLKQRLCRIYPNYIRCAGEEELSTVCTVSRTDSLVANRLTLTSRDHMSGLCIKEPAMELTDPTVSIARVIRSGRVHMSIGHSCIRGRPSQSHPLTPTKTSLRSAMSRDLTGQWLDVSVE